MNKFYLFATSLALIFSSCSNSNNADVEIPEGNIKPLSLFVNIETPTSKTGNSSDVSDEIILGDVTTGNLNRIGVHICQHENFGTAYINGSHNTIWTKTGSTWGTTTPVYLGSDGANVYAYYPYINNAALEVDKIPVTVGDIDYLFGKAEQAEAENNNNSIFIANNQKPTVSINMKHAMSQIIWNFTKDATYTGTAKVEKIEFSSLHPDGSLNINTGKIAPSAAIKHVLSDVLTIGESATSKNLMIIPTDYSKNKISMTITIDDKTLTTDVNIDFERAKKYNFNVQVSGKGISIGNVVVEDWGTGSDTDIDFS